MTLRAGAAIAVLRNIVGWLANGPRIYETAVAALTMD
jgi:hypothetical protein